LKQYINPKYCTIGEIKVSAEEINRNDAEYKAVVEMTSHK
jgi:hypothetical protein